MTRLAAFYSAVALFAVSATVSSASSRRMASLATQHVARPFSARPLRESKCPSWPSGSGMLKDGDFSGAKDPGDGYVPVRQRRLPGWKASYNVNLMGSQYFALPGPICSVDIGGQPPFAGDIEQKLSFTEAGTYAVSFILSGNGNCGNQQQQLMAVITNRHGWHFDNYYNWDTSNGNDAQHGFYQTESWQFNVYTSERFPAWLYFQTPGDCGPVIAAISVTKTSSSRQ